MPANSHNNIAKYAIISKFHVCLMVALILQSTQCRQPNNQKNNQQQHQKQNKIYAQRNYQSYEHPNFILYKNQQVETQNKKGQLNSPYQQQANNIDTCILNQNNTLQTITLGNCQNQLYYIKLGIGTPPQYFTLQLDTGSNVLWVPTINANILGFNSTNSTTYSNLSQPYQIQYVNGGLVQGTYGTDFVTISNTSINVSMSVVFADTVSGLSLPNGILGVVGFGYTSVQTQPNFLDLAYAKGQIETNNFSLSLQNEQNINSTANSLMFYNKISQSLINNSLFSAVADTFYWQVNLIGVLADSLDLTPYAANVAVIDSGTSLFYMNPPLTQQFISTFLPNSLCNFTDGLNICNITILSQLPDLKFIFSDVAVKLTPLDYTQCFGTVCYVHIYSIQINPPQVLLGDTLFMKYNITFSKSQKIIGFQGDIQYVGVFGKNQGFIISQYVLGAISLLILILFLILMVLMLTKDKRESNGIQKPVTQRLTQLTVRIA